MRQSLLLLLQCVIHVLNIQIHNNGEMERERERGRERERERAFVCV